MDDSIQANAPQGATPSHPTETANGGTATGQNMPVADSTSADLARGTQFLGEEYVLSNRVAMRDDLSITQTRKGGTNSVTSRHVRNFLYDQPFHTDAPGYHETPSQPRHMPLKPEER